MAQQTIDVEVQSKAQEAVSEVKKLSGSMEDLNKSLNTTQNTLKKIDFSNIFTSGIKSAERLGKKIFDLSKASIDASESLNLFNRVFGNVEKNGETTFSKLGLKATQFQNRMNEGFSTNKIETMKYQGLYQSMANNMGVKDTYAEIMSEGMTQLMYDLASLYNKSEGQVATAIQSSIYSGNVRPMKNFGIDVTQNGIAGTLGELGIDRSVSDLSQAEKQILRYITALNQAKIAQRDFADTISSPANQLKILKQQFAELSIAIGNLFSNALARILPYVNAIIMVAKEVVKTIASIFGIQLKDYGGQGVIEDLADSYEDVGTSAGNATKAVKELKRQTLGFDQINNITSPSSSGSSGGGGAGGMAIGGIDSRLLDAIKSYDNGLENVQNKARDIRDRIMEWLGFTKHTNKETGEVYFTYDGIKKTLSNMWESFVNLDTKGKLLVSTLTALFGVAMYNKIKSLVEIIGNSGLLKVLGSLFAPLGELKTEFTKFAKSVTEKMGIDVNEAWGKFNEKIKSAGKLLLGGGEIYVGISLIRDGVQGLVDGKGAIINLFETLLGVASTITGVMTVLQTLWNVSTVASGWIGIAVAGLTTLVSWLTSTKKETEELKTENQELVESYNKILESAEKSYTADNVKLNHTKELADELNLLVGANGNVLESDKSRVAYILDYLNKTLGTEYKLIGDQITQNGKVVTSIDEINDAVQRQINKMRQKAILTRYEETYNKALEEQAKQTDKINTIRANLQIIEVKLKTARENGTAEEINHLVDLQKKYKDNLKEAQYYYNEYSGKIEAYENLYGDSLTDNVENTTKYMKILMKDVETYTADTTTNIKKDMDGKFEKVEYQMPLTVDPSRAYKTVDDLKFGEKKIQVDADTTKAQKSLNLLMSNVKIGISAVTSIISKSNANGGLFSNGTWKPITQYASGGLPSMGQMFIAREAGPELVGKIGNATAVMNNNQIVSSVASGVAQAVKSVMGNGTSAVEVYVHTDEGTVVDRINRTTRQTGVCPIVF